MRLIEIYNGISQVYSICGQGTEFISKFLINALLAYEESSKVGSSNFGDNYEKVSVELLDVYN